MAYNTLRKFFCHFKRLYFDLHWSHSYPCKIPNLTWGVYHTILHLQPTFFSIYGVKIDAKLYMTNLFSFIFPVVLTSFIIWDLLCYGTSSYCLEVYHQNAKIKIHRRIIQYFVYINLTVTEWSTQDWPIFFNNGKCNRNRIQLTFIQSLFAYYRQWWRCI